MLTHERSLTVGEEIANSITHGVGAVLSVAGLVVMIVIASVHRSAWQTAAFAVYGISLVLLYISSTIYHGLANNRAKQVFQVLDHCAIYILIAGTYTPFTLVTLRGPSGWMLFGFVWALCVCGIIFKSLWIGRLKTASTVVYLMMGWCAIFAIRPLLAALPVSGFLWLMAGGLCYSLGVIFFASSRKYAHSVWHIFVLAGSVCHYWAVYRYVLIT